MDNQTATDDMLQEYIVVQCNHSPMIRGQRDKST
jgi:hypothetical protein